MRGGKRGNARQVVLARAEILSVAEVLGMVAGRKPNWSVEGAPTIGPVLGILRVVDVKIVEYGDSCRMVGLPPTVHRGDTLEFFNETQWPVTIAFVGNGAGELDPNPLGIEVGCEGKVLVTKKNQGKPKTHVTVNCHRTQKAKKAMTTKKAQPPTIVPLGGPDMGIADP